MKARNLFGGVCLTMVILAAGIAPEGALAQTRVSHATLAARAGTIVGTVSDGSEKPIAAARLRLRDLTSGRMVMTTRGDQEGQFRFTGVPPGSYVVELVDEAGGVSAVGPTFGIAADETVATFIRLGGRVPWYRGFFTNAAVGAVSSAAGLGLTAVGTGMQPASGRN